MDGEDWDDFKENFRSNRTGLRSDFALMHKLLKIEDMLKREFPMAISDLGTFVLTRNKKDVKADLASVKPKGKLTGSEHYIINQIFK